MRYVARGSVILGVLALIMTMFNFQPTVEAAFDIANDSQLQLNIQQQFITENIELGNQLTTTVNTPDEATAEVADDPTNATKNESELAAEAKAYRATAYCLRGKTASGSRVRRGIVAADTRILPLGTRIQVQAGSYSGTYTVADTGGRIKGRILDIWMPSCAEAIRFGRRSIKVTVLGKKSRKKRR